MADRTRVQGTVRKMNDSPQHSPQTPAGEQPAGFRVRVLDRPWTLIGRGLVATVQVLEGEARAPALLSGGGRVLGVDRPIKCFGRVPDPYPIDLLLQGVKYEIAKGDELVGNPQ